MLPWSTHCVSPFFLGCPGRLSLKAGRSSFLWSQLAEDRIVLDGVSWQFGLPLFILGCFFLLGMGLGLCMKWIGAVEFFDPTYFNIKICIRKFHYNSKIKWVDNKGWSQNFKLARARVWWKKTPNRHLYSIKKL